MSVEAIKLAMLRAKVAEEAAATEEDPRIKELKRRQRIGYWGTAGVVGAGAGSPLALLKGTKLTADEEQFNRVLDTIVGTPGAPDIAFPKMSPAELLSRGPGYYSPYKNRISIHNDALNAGVLAHEMGHHDFMKSTPKKLMPLRLGAYTFGKYSPLVGIGAGLASGYSDDPRATMGAVAAPIVASTPLLVEEIAAWVKGLQRMRRAGLPRRAQLKNMAIAVPALTGYAAIPAAGAMGAYYTDATVRKHRLQKQLEQQMKQQQGSEKSASGDTQFIPPPPQAGKEHRLDNTAVLEKLFVSRDGLAQNSKKDLRRYFDTTNPQYAMREQTLVEKVAHIMRKIRG